MTITVITPKLSVSQNIQWLFSEIYPNKEIAYIATNGFGHLHRVYPRGLALDSYPKIDEISLKLSDSVVLNSTSYTVTASGQAPVDVHTALNKAKTIYVIYEPSNSDVFHTVEFLTKINPNALKLAQFIPLYALDAASLKNGVEQAKIIEKIKEEPAYIGGYIKAYFDFNWNQNSIAVFSNLFKLLKTKQQAPISKYSLQTLMLLATRGSIKEGDLIDLMKNSSIGSITSRGSIVESLQSNGLLSANAMGLKVSPLGAVFLSMLHKDCKDPNLSSRLEQWCAEGLSAKPKIDRYIRTFFGKQLRFQRKLANQA